MKLAYHETRRPDFMNLISPFLGSALSSGGVGSAGGGGGGEGPIGSGASATGNSAATAQSFMSAFSNSDGGPGTNNPFSDFFSLGSSLSEALKKRKNDHYKSAGRHPLSPHHPSPPRTNTRRQLAKRRRINSKMSRRHGGGNNRRTAAAAHSTKRRWAQGVAGGNVPPPPNRFMPKRHVGDDFRTSAARRRRQASLFRTVAQSKPQPFPDIFTLLEPIAKRSRERAAHRTQSSPGNGGGARVAAHRSSSTPFGRLADNFGNNFFKMLNELHEYANVAQTPQPPPPPQQPYSVATQSVLTNAVPSAQSDDVRHVANDLLDANMLMRNFLRTMSRDSTKPLQPLAAHDDGTEAGRNRPLMDQLFESDILLTSRQMKAIVLAEAERKNPGYFQRRVKRKVITGGVYRWPKNSAISYSFREPDKKWRSIIREGLRMWERETCVRFRENGGGKDRIEFIRGSGCYSSVGKTGGSQKISIGFGCEDRGIVSHEVGHALGFWHEQSRPDRDHYIHLDDRYIAGGTEGNFARRSDLEIDGMGLPYDLGSVMHYGPNAFTTDWDHITIVTLDKKYQHTIGQRRSPSFIDVKQINRLYCHQVCAGTTVQCVNGGYADPNDCRRCKCPHGLGGPSCATVEPSEGLCGGELLATNQWHHLTHKGRNKCVWRITANQARIRFIVDSVSYKCDTTCRSFVEIKHNSDFQQIGFRACCDNQKGVEVVSEQDELLIMSVLADDHHHLDGIFSIRYIQDSGAPLPRPPPPAWIPGSENRAFRGVQGKGGVIEKFILNAIPRVRDPQRPVESVFSIFTDYFASSLLGTSRDH